MTKWQPAGALYAGVSRLPVPVTILPTEGCRYMSKVKKWPDNAIRLASFHLAPGLGSLYYLFFRDDVRSAVGLLAFSLVCAAIYSLFLKSQGYSESEVAG